VDSFRSNRTDFWIPVEDGARLVTIGDAWHTSLCYNQILIHVYNYPSFAPYVTIPLVLATDSDIIY
jgi:hypothetical protein